jgi:hypothetical protein
MASRWTHAIGICRLRLKRPVKYELMIIDIHH